MAGHKKTSDELIIAALCKCGSVIEAAKALGVSKNTVANRMNDDAFKTRYEEAKQNILSEAVNSMKLRTAKAINTLTEIMEDKSNPATVRVSAADSILRHTLRYIEVAELEARIKRLEMRDNNV